MSADLALSRRQLEVLQLAAKGLTSAQIARRLRVKEHTVVTHRSLLFGKLGAVNMANAVDVAHKRGLLGEVHDAARHSR